MRQHDSRYRNGSPLTTAKAWRYGAAMAGEDAMPLQGDCTDPLYREIRGAESNTLAALRVWKTTDVDWAPGHGFIGDLHPSPPRTETAYIKVRCRKCAACLMHRRKVWTAKAILETRASHRTWFVTLTFDPMRRFIAKASAETITANRRCEAFGMLTPNERYKAIERVTSLEVTKWLKRLRKNTGARLRYIVIAEAHSDGFPHYHALIHETANGAVTKRAIQSTWNAGFSNAKLVDTTDAKATGYVCKYLSKSASTRVRASQKYGGAATAANALSEAVEKVEQIRRRLLTATSQNRE